MSQVRSIDFSGILYLRHIIIFGSNKLHKFGRKTNTAISVI
uniref:Uncharacterized protein n=1 Tax=Arundo donax TaxID=35708 RepID=A0A0A8ZNF5_ARUDO